MGCLDGLLASSLVTDPVALENVTDIVPHIGQNIGESQARIGSVWGPKRVPEESFPAGFGDRLGGRGAS